MFVELTGYGLGGLTTGSQRTGRTGNVGDRRHGRGHPSRRRLPDHHPLAAVGLITQHPGLLPVHAPKARDFTNRRYRH